MRNASNGANRTPRVSDGVFAPSLLGQLGGLGLALIVSSGCSPAGPPAGLQPESPISVITIAPATVLLSTGASARFTVAARREDGTTLVPGVTWAATGGTIEAGGLYTAGNAAGTFHVVAVQQGGSLADTAVVTITAPSAAPVFFSEGFEGADLAGNGWFDATAVTTAAEARPGSAGSRSLQLHWTPASTAPQGSSRRDFGPSSSVYLSYWVKHSGNWVGSGRNYHPHLFQMITTADDHFIGPSITHLTVYDELLYLNGNLTAQLAIQDALMIDATKLNVDLRGVTEQRSIGGYNGQHEFSDAGSSVLWDTYLHSPGQYTNYKLFRTRAAAILDGAKGGWHHLESYWQLNSVANGIGLPDGVLQYWVDGALMVDRHDVYYRTGANPEMRFSTLLLAPYIGDGSPADQYMWIDDLTVSSARP